MRTICFITHFTSFKIPDFMDNCNSPSFFFNLHIALLPLNSNRTGLNSPYPFTSYFSPGGGPCSGNRLHIVGHAVFLDRAGSWNGPKRFFGVPATVTLISCSPGERKLVTSNSKGIHAMKPTRFPSISTVADPPFHEGN